MTLTMLTPVQLAHAPASFEGVAFFTAILCLNWLANPVRARLTNQTMSDPEEQLPYHVAPEGDRFKVIDSEGNVVITCENAANADQYAALMNQSYRRGYNAGFRKARRVQR